LAFGLDIELARLHFPGALPKDERLASTSLGIQAPIVFFPNPTLARTEPHPLVSPDPDEIQQVIPPSRHPPLCLPPHERVRLSVPSPTIPAASILFSQ
jgi:hypothetical protein